MYDVYECRATPLVLAATKREGHAEPASGAVGDGGDGGDDAFRVGSTRIFALNPHLQPMSRR